MYKGPEQYLDSDAAASRVMAHARLLLKLSRRFEAIAPAGFRHSAHVANYKSGKIIIHTDNGAVASKIRQMSQRLCEHAFSEGSHDNLSVIMLGMNDEITKTKTHRETDNAIALDQGLDSDRSHAQDINHYRLPTGLAVGAQIDSFVVKKIIARTARS